jgi:hypothetical protein
MDINEFYDRLYSVGESYHWDVDTDNGITATIQSGVSKGTKLNPITALAHKARLGLFTNNKRDTIFAAHLLGIPRKFAENVYKASFARQNRGNAQVLRGRIKATLGV